MEQQIVEGDTVKDYNLGIGTVTKIDADWVYVHYPGYKGDADTCYLKGTEHSFIKKV